MIVSALDNRYFAAKYAVAEAKRAMSYIRSENEMNVNKLTKDLGLHFKKKGDNYLIHFTEYLKSSPGSPEYFLINKDLSKGYVKVTKHERNRLLEEAIRLRIKKTLPKKGKIPDIYKKEVEASAKKIIKELPGPVSKEIKFSGDIAPCIQKLLDDLYANKNLSHHARWSLAIYLNKTGKSKEEILNIFSNSPDFNLSIAEYQIKYIKEKGYSMPSCTTMKTYGLCIANCRCFNPLKYRRGMERRSERRAA